MPWPNWLVLPSGSAKFSTPWTSGLWAMPQIVPGAPEVVALLGEDLVDLLGVALLLRRIGLGPVLVEQLVDLRVLDAAEVQGQLTDRQRDRRVPPDVLVVEVEAAVVAPLEDLEVAQQGGEDVVAPGRSGRCVHIVDAGLLPPLLLGLGDGQVGRVLRGGQGEVQRARVLGLVVGDQLLGLRPCPASAGSRCPRGSRAGRARTARWRSGTRPARSSSMIAGWSDA